MSKQPLLLILLAIGMVCGFVTGGCRRTGDKVIPNYAKPGDEDGFEVIKEGTFFFATDDVVFGLYGSDSSPAGMPMSVERQLRDHGWTVRRRLSESDPMFTEATRNEECLWYQDFRSPATTFAEDVRNQHDDIPSLIAGYSAVVQVLFLTSC